jgi:CBS domain-containing protein
MAKLVRDIMKTQPIRLQGSTPVIEAARQMFDANVGAVIVADDGKIAGIVTDRDITMRVVAQGRDPSTTSLSQICSCNVATLSPDDEIDRAVQVMRDNAIRRVPVVDSQNEAVGIVSLGDLALERDPRSALGRISAAPPNR